MSLINQMLRDLDNREAGEKGVVAMPPPVLNNGSRRHGTRWKGIALLLVVLSLLIALWFSAAGEILRQRLSGALAGAGATPVSGPLAASDGTSRQTSPASAAPLADVEPLRSADSSGARLPVTETRALADEPVTASVPSVDETPEQSRVSVNKPRIAAAPLHRPELPVTGVSPVKAPETAQNGPGVPASRAHPEVESGTGTADPGAQVGTAGSLVQAVASATVVAVDRPVADRSPSQQARKDSGIELTSRPALQVQPAEQTTGGRLTPAPDAANVVNVSPAPKKEAAELAQVSVTRADPKVMRQSAEGAYREAREQLEAGNGAEAERGLRHALSLDSALHPARQMLSLLLWQQGDRRESERLLREGLKMTPLHVPFVLLMGRMMIESGEIEGTRLLLERYRAGSGEDPDLLSLLGSVHQQAGRFAEAVAVYRELLLQRPGDARGLAGLAIALDARGEHEEALTRYRAALAAGQLPPAVSGYARQRVAALTSEH